MTNGELVKLQHVHHTAVRKENNIEWSWEKVFRWTKLWGSYINLSSCKTPYSYSIDWGWWSRLISLTQLVRWHIWTGLVSGWHMPQQEVLHWKLRWLLFWNTRTILDFSRCCTGWQGELYVSSKGPSLDGSSLNGSSLNGSMLVRDETAR